MAGKGKYFEDLVGQLYRLIDNAGGHTANDALGEAIEAARDRMFRQAREARDELREKLVNKTKAERKDWLRNRDDFPREPSKDGPSVVTAAIDPETGITKAGVNHRSNKPHPYGGCAEDDALDRINAERQKLGKHPLGRHQVYYSEALRIDTGSQMPICNRNCQEVSDPKQYPPGTEPMQPGRWTDPNRTDIPGGVE